MLRQAEEIQQEAFADLKAELNTMMWTGFSNIIANSHDQLNLRGQRRTLLSYLVDDLAQIVSADNELTAGAIEVRNRAVEYLALVQQTDAAIESDFVLNSTSSQLWTSGRGWTPTYCVNLAALSRTSDRVAFLIAYCNERFKDATDDVIRSIVPLLRSSFAALSMELVAAVDVAEAFTALTEQAMNVKAISSSEDS